MNILQVSPSYKPAYVYGGPTVSVTALAVQLAGSGAAVAVFTTTANGKQELEVITGKRLRVDKVEVTYFKRLTGDPTHFSPSLLWAAWKNIPRFDVIHIHAWWNTVSVLTCLLAVWRGKKVVLSPRGTLSSYSFTNRSSFSKGLIHKLIGKNLLKRCFLHATSAKEKEQLLKFTTVDKITVIPNFVQLPAALPLRVATPGNAVFNLLFFSRIEEKKGLNLLFKALAMVKFSYRLTLAGGGDAAYISALKVEAATLGIDAEIDWIGPVSPDDKFTCFAQHDLLVLPSHDENFANVIPECLATGTPVLVSREVGLSDYVTAAGLGWVCELSAENIASTLETAFADPAQRNQIINNAPGKIRQDFASGAILKSYLALYSDTNERL